MAREIPFEKVLREHLTDPAFRAEWERGAVAEATAVWFVQYRALHGLSIDDLAARLDLDAAALLALEAGDVEPPMGWLLTVSRRLGEEIHLRIDRTGDLSEAEHIVIGAPAAAELVA